MTGSAATIKFDPMKFADLILYIAHRCRDDERFGFVKLSKIVYYCDFEGFKRTLKPITGATYLKKPQGPFPAALEDTRSWLTANGSADVMQLRVIDYNENRLVPTSDQVELSDKFSVAERQIIDDVIEKMQPMNAADLTEYSHGDFGWEHGEMNEPITYTTALVPRSDEPWVVELIAERGM